MVTLPALFPFLAIVVGAVGDATDVDECPDTSHAVYDYVVVGSGAGGGPLAARLAENGFSGTFLVTTWFALSEKFVVLVIETGDNVVNINTTSAAFANYAVEGM